MKISAKGRYALAAALEIARRQNISNTYVSTVNISKTLGISKLFLEQILSNLKKAGLVTSAKGANGGYKLIASPEKITAYDILSAIETALFEKTDPTTEENAPSIESALREQIFNKLDDAVADTLTQTTLQHLLDVAARLNDEQSFMLNM